MKYTPINDPRTPLLLLTPYRNLTSCIDDELTTVALTFCVDYQIWHTCPIRQAYKVPPKYRHVPLAPTKAAAHRDGGESLV